MGMKEDLMSATTDPAATAATTGDVNNIDGVPAGTDVELLLTGMTCASCANRIERKLNKIDGVTATVNYATEKAKVTFADSVTTDDLVAAVESAGYGAKLPKPPAAADASGDGGQGGSGSDADGESDARSTIHLLAAQCGSLGCYPPALL